MLISTYYVKRKFAGTRAAEGEGETGATAEPAQRAEGSLATLGP
jgi:hypothetical protein